MRHTWASPPPQLRLDPGEVHVWRASLDFPDAEFAPMATSVSPDEQLRAARYRTAELGRDFLLARAVLRHILSRYLGVAPEELSFRYGAHGKPALANPGAQWLRFNLSHSGRLALFALARDREVGVDVEQLRPELASWQLASAFFAEGELRALRELGEELRADAFFACWTRKEAYLKGIESGLSAALNSFEVPVSLETVCDAPIPLVDGAGGWSLQPLDAGEEYVAACAAQGCDWHTRLWQWAPACGACSQAA